ncbi:polysaccharide pyruvyl transferase family protein [Shewanella algae]|uniref:polysaccharide pyruvyl transferase family protein n=1 Tax=Shewanella algae TaxID=38313 RepID=UPI001AACBA25|nr:polysaccharide pyruvyl transferase family protein [Shewanella algae]MBO2623905.1 polysaccharide pyruvyl transferase family protein [Shewanella algae]MBO2700057.1 polysaccharide pyruvyl transferase family protein [Shewanella algae]
MNILHIAAFQGNIGDNASHKGFEKIFESIGLAANVDRLEIRKAYNNYKGVDKLYFDQSFVDLSAKYDLIIFGGGGFLDYWVEGSVNGTTINISNEIFDRLKCKVLITSVGCNPHRTVPHENFAKFRKFLDYLKSTDKVKVALRNDGSNISIERDFGPNYNEIFSNVLDNGFFYEPSSTPTLSISGNYAAINITKDQLEMGSVDLGEKEWYFAEIERIIKHLVTQKLKIVFVPHIHDDICAISEVISSLPNDIVRNHTVVAPCFQGDYATDFIFNIYRSSQLTIASRYHANVCSLVFGVPTIGLSPLQRIEFLHEQVSSTKSSFYIKPGFSEGVINCIKEKTYGTINSESIRSLKSDTVDFYRCYFNDL